MKKVLLTILSGLLFLTFVSTANADQYGTNCQPVYGGGQTCEISESLVLNKMVLNPQTKQYVDNLTINDPRYFANQTVNFQLTVKNTGNNNFSEVDIADIFPSYITTVTGPGNYDSASKTLSFKISNLNPNESRTFTLTAKVVSQDQLPASQGITCVVNQASATTNDNIVSKDAAQFCIEKQIPTTTKGGLTVYPAQPIQQTPATGPEALTLFGLIPTGGLGLFLRRKASK